MTNLFDDTNTNVNPLEELVGDGKKFKTVEDLAKGKLESDNYIRTLEQQMDELRKDHLSLRDEYQSRATLAEMIDQLKDQQLSSNTTTNAPEVRMPDTSNFVSKSEIESLLSSQLQRLEATKKEQENSAMVASKLKERYGENYKTVLKEQVEELGLTEETVNDLARKHPKLLFRTLGLDQPATSESFQAPPRSSVNNNQFTPKNQKRTWNWYQNLKKENPKLYWDPKTVVQMHKDASELGEAFKDGDYNRYN